MKSTTWEKYLGSKSPAGKFAQGVTTAVGGKGITDYVGGRGTKRGLAQGVANVAMAVGSGGAGILRVAAKRAATKAIAKKVANVGRGPLSKFVDRKFRREEEEIFKNWRKK